MCFMPDNKNYNEVNSTTSTWFASFTRSHPFLELSKACAKMVQNKAEPRHVAAASDTVAASSVHITFGASNARAFHNGKLPRDCPLPSPRQEALDRSSFY